jgi:mannose-1-phosphate guanylyltransferase
MVASILAKKFGDEPMAIIWSDHMVKQEELFCKILLMAGDRVQKKENDFIFIAQKPRFANQNMGWIEVGKEISVEEGVRLFRFSRLRYRPTLQEAEQYFHNQNFVWNLGYFVTTPKFLTSMFSEYAPQMSAKLEEISESYGSPDFTTVCARVYPTIEQISFDDAILTRLMPDNIGVFSADLGWSDIGAWESLKEALTDHEHQNVVRGNVLTEDCRDSIMFSESKQLVVGIDLDGFVVINTDDVVLVCPKSAVPKIKKIVESLIGTPHEHLT